MYIEKHEKHASEDFHVTTCAKDAQPTGVGSNHSNELAISTPISSRNTRLPGKKDHVSIPRPWPRARYRALRQQPSVPGTRRLDVGQVASEFVSFMTEPDWRFLWGISFGKSHPTSAKELCGALSCRCASADENSTGIKGRVEAKSWPALM